MSDVAYTETPPDPPSPDEAIPTYDPFERAAERTQASVLLRKQESPPSLNTIGYDVPGAMKAGFDVTAIADHLAKKSGYDIEGARKAGAEDDEIVAHLAGLRRDSIPATMGIGAARGAIKSTGIAGGALAGARAGAAAGALAGPYAPVAVPAGAILGGVAGGAAGWYGGEQVAEQLPQTKDVSPERRKFDVAGETFGGAVPLAVTPFGIPSAMATRGGAFLSKIGDTARTHPKAFLASEASGALSASAAGGMAETVRPDDPWTRAGAEAAGGIVNPSRLMLSFVGPAYEATKQAASRFSAAGTENRAASRLAELVAKSGEDPAALAAALRAPDVAGITTTAAQKTGSPILSALERKLAGDSATFGGKAEQVALDSMASIKGMIHALGETGDPGALKAAADLREKYFRNLLGVRLNNAEEQAVAAIGKVRPGEDVPRSELSRRAADAVHGALTDARSYEKELWNQVPKGETIIAKDFLATYGTLKDQMLRERPLDPVIDAVAKRLLDQGGADTVGEMIKIRSDFLGGARKASAAGEFNDARMYGELAESVLDDMARMSNGRPAYDAARQFSNELNTVFRRSFAGDALALNIRGADRLPPEVLLDRAFAGGREAGALRSRELQNASQFMSNRGGDAGNASTLASTQEQFLRSLAMNAMTPEGHINPTKLATFVQKNSETLARFPELQAQLTDLATASSTLTKVTQQARDAETLLFNPKVTAFARISGFEDPSKAVMQAVGSAEPVRNLEMMARFAKRGGNETRNGLQASVYDAAYNVAKTGEGFSFDKYRQFLFAPLGRNQPSVMDTLKNSGVMTVQAGERAKQLLDRAQTIEQSLGNRAKIDEVLSAPDAMFDLVLRITGAKLGTTMAATHGGGDSLIAAGAGSKSLRNMFEKVPTGRIRDVLIEASLNPEFMAKLLTKASTPAQRIKLGNQIHAYLLHAGIVGAEGAVREEKPRQ